MHGLAAIQKAQRAGVELYLADDGRLLADSFGPPNAALLAQLRQAKADIIATLTSPVFPTPCFELIQDATRLREHLVRMRAAGRVALDVETGGLNPRQDRLGLVQLAVADYPVVIVDALAVDTRMLQPLFDGGRTLVSFNAKFDLAFLVGRGIDLRAARVSDPMLAELVINASGEPFRRDEHSLEACVLRRLGCYLPKTEQVSDWLARPLTAHQLAYAARDAAVLLALDAAQAPEIERAGLRATVDLENRALLQIVDMERVGVPLDVELWRRGADASVSDKYARRHELYALIGESPPAVNGPRLTGRSEIWTSPPQIKTLLRSRGHAVDNTSANELIALAANEPLASGILAFRKANLRASNYGVEYLAKYLSPDDNRIHPEFRQIGASTGRMSAAGGRIQQIPRGPTYRSCFRPGPGKAWVKSDYSQVELRFIADLTQDPALLEAYAHNVDVHALTASRVLNKALEDVTELERQKSKAVNFGLSYGQGSQGLQRYALKEFGVMMTLDEAAAWRRAFFVAYPGIARWHADYATPPGVLMPRETRTPIGRRRSAVQYMTGQLASPIQGAGGDAIKAALALCWERAATRPSSASIVLAVHDELALECGVDDAAAAADWLHSCMVDALQPMLRHVPAVADVTIGQSWAGEPLESPME